MHAQETLRTKIWRASLVKSLPTSLATMILIVVASNHLAADDDYSWIRGANYVPSYAATDVVLWLDYDHVLSEDVVDTVVLASSHLSCGSLLLATVDVEPPGLPGEGPDEWRVHYLNEARRFLGPTPETAAFAKSNLPSLNASILNKAIAEGLIGRAGVRFCPLFHFLYADGHEMLSVGGMIASAVSMFSPDRGK